MVGNLVLCALRHVAELLNREGIEWAIAGGVALSFWDHTRNTKDADFLIAVDNRSVDDILAAFQAAGLRPKRTPPVVTVGEQRFVQFWYEPPEIDFEIQVDFLFAERAFQQRAIERRLPTSMPDWDLKLYVLACEDLIVFKLAAGRIIDFADAAALLRANRSLINFSLLRSECQQLSLATELDQVWHEAFPDAAMPGVDA